MEESLSGNSSCVRCRFLACSALAAGPFPCDAFLSCSLLTCSTLTCSTGFFLWACLLSGRLLFWSSFLLRCFLSACRFFRRGRHFRAFFPFFFEPDRKGVFLGGFVF